VTGDKAGKSVKGDDTGRPKRSTLVIDRIVAWISEGRLKPGDRMPSIEALTQEFSVGRTSVREALMALELVGVVEVVHGDGTFIRQDVSGCFLKPLSWTALLDRSKIAGLVETRRCMESELAAMAAQRAAPNDIAEIERQLLRMEEVCRQPDEYAKVDSEFHLAIWKAARNEVMLSMLASIADVLKRIMAAAVSNAPHSIQAGLLAHRHIFEAIASRDPEAARFGMRRHMDNFGRLAVSASLEQEVV
jgi:GntR family transcriptional regulator, transcriptional repressor for pyruvate dehydrogenase complex